MLPIRDRNPGERFPYVTYSLLTVSVALFLFELYLDYLGQLDAFIGDWAMVPERILAGRDTITLLTSMFLHGGFMHIFGNMLYLFIFGNNVEDVFGHIGFLAFYLLCGLSASFLHIVAATHPTVPTIGASGAIAGVLGAYLAFYPRAKIDTLIFAFFITWVTIPAAALLVFWFLMQIMSGLLSITAYAPSGVAYFAHVGGFAAGVLLALPLRGRVGRRPRQPRVVYLRGVRDEYWI